MNDYDFFKISVLSQTLSLLGGCRLRRCGVGASFVGSHAVPVKAVSVNEKTQVSVTIYVSSATHLFRYLASRRLRNYRTVRRHVQQYSPPWSAVALALGEGTNVSSL